MMTALQMEQSSIYVYILFSVLIAYKCGSLRLPLNRFNILLVYLVMS